MLAGHIQNGKIIIELAWHARLLCFSDPLSLGVLSPILFPFFMCPTLEEQAATPTSLLFMWQIRSHSSKLIEIWSAAAASSHDYKWGSRDFLLWWSSLEIGLFLTPKKKKTMMMSWKQKSFCLWSMPASSFLIRLLPSCPPLLPHRHLLWREQFVAVCWPRSESCPRNTRWGRRGWYWLCQSPIQTEFGPTQKVEQVLIITRKAK